MAVELPNNLCIVAVRLKAFWMVAIQRGLRLFGGSRRALVVQKIEQKPGIGECHYRIIYRFNPPIPNDIASHLIAPTNLKGNFRAVVGYDQVAFVRATNPL